MSDRIYNVLFICTGNSARSIIAEGILNQLGRKNFKAFSAGSHPTGTLNPLALSTLARLHVPTDGFRSKNWDEFARPDSPELHFVFTVCDKAAGETCPVWPGQPMTAHWGVPDPASVQGSDEQKQRAFNDVAIILKRRIEFLLAVPLHRLHSLALQRELTQIGKK